MMRAYALLFLLLMLGVLRAPSLAQEPAPQSPTKKSSLSFVAEIMRRRISPPTITIPDDAVEEPVLRIETVVLRLPDPNAGLKKSESYLESLSELYETAVFQRQRFFETGQPIEFERGNLFFHQDRYVVTKGFILYRIRNDRIDFGLYQRGFHGDASPDHARATRTDPRLRGNDHGDDRQYFFGVRFRLGKSPQREQ
jgi:hypothetical protein